MSIKSNAELKKIIYNVFRKDSVLKKMFEKTMMCLFSLKKCSGVLKLLKNY